MSEFALAVVLVNELLEEGEKNKLKRKRKHSYWVKPWLQKRNRFSHENLLKELKLTSAEDYQNWIVTHRSVVKSSYTANL